MPDLQSLVQSAASVLLVPPVNLAFLAFVAVLLRLRWLAMAALALLLLLALPAVSGTLLASLETGLPPGVLPSGALPSGALPPGAPPPGAIVILGGDVLDVAPIAASTERVRAAEPGPLTLERLRAGAALGRATHLPILVTGGVVNPDTEPVAVLMARSLAADFGIPARWIEPASRDTWENAAFSAELLRRDGIGTVFVVTHAWHMRRALVAFAKTGITAIPAPLPLDRWPDYRAHSFVPRVSSWLNSFFALHEWIGGLWYPWRGHG